MECANYRRKHKDSKKKVPGWKFPGVGTSSGLGRRAPPRKCKTIFLSHTSCIYQNKTKKIMCFFTWTLLDEQTLKHWNAERQQIRTKRFELYRVILKENTLCFGGQKRSWCVTWSVDLSTNIPLGNIFQSIMLVLPPSKAAKQVEGIEHSEEASPNCKLRALYW